MATMTDVRVGDRVRVTSVVEALVTEVYDGGFSMEGPHYWDRKPDNETREVEVLEREYPLGTLYRTGRNTAVKAEGEYWIWLDTGERSSVVNDRHVRETIRAGDDSTVHEPPTT